MKIIIPGGSGHIGQFLSQAFAKNGHDVVVLSRSRSSSRNIRTVWWDGRNDGPWVQEMDGADVVINLSGKSVNCSYSVENLSQMLTSRTASTAAVGRAIAASTRPPGVWLQMSTATIYAHRFDAPNDEQHGIVGGNEPGVPSLWKKSIDIAMAWEHELDLASTPQTRKVALRTSMVMHPSAGGPLAAFRLLAKTGLGGSIAGGRQYISWIHWRDFLRALEFLIARDDISGVVNLAAPEPIPQIEFARILRSACRMPIGLPAAKWMLEIGSFLLRTETELVLKSRRVVPGRLLESGFQFDFPTWSRAAEDLVSNGVN